MHEISAHVKEQLTRTTAFHGQKKNQQRLQIHVTHADNGIGSLTEFVATHKD